MTHLTSAALDAVLTLLDACPDSGGLVAKMRGWLKQDTTTWVVGLSGLVAAGVVGYLHLTGF